MNEDARNFVVIKKEEPKVAGRANCPILQKALGLYANLGLGVGREAMMIMMSQVRSLFSASEFLVSCLFISFVGPLG